MSKLDELIAEYCPNGVPFIALKDCIESVSNIKWVENKDSEFQYIDLTSVDRETHSIVETSTINADTAPSRAQQIVKTNDILLGTTRPLLKRYCIIPMRYNGEICSTGFCVLRAKSSVVLPRYLYHVISTTDFFDHVEKFQKGASYPAITDADVKKYKIPAPSIEVQREIVRILDKFTELTARKQQYEYYRDHMLTFDTTIPKVTLREIAIDIYRGAGIKRNEVTPDGIPCVRYGEIYTTYNTYFDTCVSHTQLEYVSSPKYFEYGDILFAITGESVEDIAKSVAYVGHDKCLAGGDIVVLKHKQNPKYLAYVLSTYEARQQKSKGKIKSKVVHSSVPSIESIEIPLPSLQVQEKIANLLDNFETICNDLNVGLPAEIEARKKQYEFYRDGILTFVESGQIITDRQTDNRSALIRLCQYVFGVVFVKLSDVVTVFRGEYITKKDATTGNIPVILGGQEPAYYIDKANHEGEVVTVARSGASAGFVAYWNEPIFITDCFGYESRKRLISTRYLYYVLKNMESELNNMKRGAGVPHISGEAILAIMIPLPSLDEQTKLVSILDRFDILCSDMAEGIPSEIEARQKQYEYYRDKLLTFRVMEG